ncbi:MAG: polyphenol oxidase family protein [Bacteroides sp.]|nr:polyphenol oxidase family protein [Bacteroides sp.]MCM1414131.1 polyphenol oxidase family protein [Bacteroides sp.]MCM1470997.1 polyphenol oxidase family protein [Bacteroides sp.]
MKIESIPLLRMTDVVAFSTLRSATDIDNPYDGFSICNYTGDTAEHIDACRRALCARLDIADDHLIVPRQTHSCNVAVIDRFNFHSIDLNSVDALVTAESGTALCINTADCVPLVMADSDAGVIAVAHSGWRGTVGSIAASTINAMVSCGASLDRIHVAMGPSICCDCFEVGEEVARIFRDSFPKDTVDDSHDKPHVDLKKAIKSTLILSGIAPDRIHISYACSRCLSDIYFSARRSGIASGRTLTVAMRQS